MGKSLNEMVTEFHKTFLFGGTSVPTMLTKGDGLECEQAALQLEETMLAMKATAAAGEGGEVMARASYILEELIEFLRANDLVGQIDALADGIYFGAGSAQLAGVDIDPIIENCVHKANMRKLFPDGKAHFNEMGKIIKPYDWVGPEPDIIAEIERQTKEAESRE